MSRPSDADVAEKEPAPVLGWRITASFSGAKVLQDFLTKPYDDALSDFIGFHQDRLPFDWLRITRLET